MGFDVEKVSMGIGPSLFKSKFKGIYFVIRMLPIGGYSKINDIDRECSGRRELIFLSAKRILIYLSGPLMNVILAFILFSLMTISFGGIPIIEATANRFTTENNIQGRELITQIDGIYVKFNEDKHKNIERNITIKHNDGTTKEINIEKYRTSSKTTLNTLGLRLKRDSIYNRIHNGKTAIKNLFNGFSNMLKELIITNNIEDLDNRNNQSTDVLSMQDMGRSNSLLLYAGLYNFAVMLVNLIPLPILDGGRVFISVCEMIIGQSINKKFMNLILWLSIVFGVIVEIYLRFVY